MSSVKGMEVDQVGDLNQNVRVSINDEKKETANTNTNITATIQSNNNSNNNNNSMEVDSENLNDSNKSSKTISNPPIPATNNHNNNNNNNNNAPKRRKKRKRDEMEIDTNKNKNNKNKNNTNSNASNTIKRRKVSTLSAKKTPKKPIIIHPMPQKWKDKHNEYKNIIISNYKSLQNEIINTNKSNNKLLFESEPLQNELTKFKTAITNNSNINLSEYISLICGIAYGRSETLTDLVIYIQNILKINTHNIREIILKSMQRKLYGIKPISKTTNKMEEKIHMNVNENEKILWNKCRVYEWECLNINEHILKAYQMDNKTKKNLSLMINKYGTFCKKYEVLNRNHKLNENEKEKELQKIEDSIIIWQGKEELNRKKKESLQKKKQEMEKLKKEKAEKKMKEKAEKLRKEKERKEKIEKEKAEKKAKSQEKKAKLEKEKAEKKARLEKEKAEKLEKQKQTKLQTVLINSNKKKRKSSFMDNWVKITKYTDTVNKNTTPIIKQRTITIACSNNNSSNNSISNSISPLSKYNILFKPAKHGKNTIIAPIHAFDDAMHTNESVIEIKMGAIVINNKYKQNKIKIKPKAIPAVFIDMESESECKSVDIHNMVSKMQIDTDNNNNNNNNNVNKQMKLQWKYRDFFEDNRPSFFGVNKQNISNNNNKNIFKLCRCPFARGVCGVNYSESDSGVEWYSDIDDLENCDSIMDEEEAALVNEIENYERDGLMRDDGFENDTFIINSDDSENELFNKNDKDIMNNIEKTKLLKHKLKNEYPIRFVTDRQRGDAIDKAISINLPSIKQQNIMKNKIYKLILKKTIVFDADNQIIVHNEKENDVQYLLQIENKNNEQKMCNGNGSEKEKKKKKKKEKKDKKEKHKNKEKEKEKNKSMKMECDNENENDNENQNENANNNSVCEEGNEDFDIKMVNKNKNKPKISKQNTLNHYFIKTPTVNKNKNKNINDNGCVINNDNNNNINDSKQEKEVEKKKKRRVVMCELVE